MGINSNNHQLARALKRRRISRGSNRLKAGSKSLVLKKRARTEFYRDAGVGSHLCGKERGSDEESVALSTKKIAALTGVLAAVAIVSAFITAGQWWEIHSGGIDTSRLAEAAKAQATTSAGQLEVVKGQLEELKKQRLLTIYTLKANLQRELTIDKNLGLQKTSRLNLPGWVINPVWRNIGSSDAVNFKGWWGVSIVYKVKNHDCPKDIDFNRKFDASADVITKGSSLEQNGDVLPIMPSGSDATLFVFGHVEYEDIFDNNQIHTL